MPTIAEVSAPMFRLAGRRINPRTNGPHRAQVYRTLSLKTIADGAERKVTLPPQPRLAWVGFSHDGKRFAFTQTTDSGIEPPEGTSYVVVVCNKECEGAGGLDYDLEPILIA